MVYVDSDYYKNTYKGTLITDEELDKMLKEASQKVDVLTFNRIRKFGFEKCSEYEKEVIKEVVCQIADFYKENEEDLKTLLSEYSLNGVTMKFGQNNNNIINTNGITILRSTYQLLSTLRFASLSMRW